MSEVKKTKQHEAQRRQRIIDHARAGKTMTEIIDIEGLDHSNPRRWHQLVESEGITITKRRKSASPVGLTKETEGWRYYFGKRVDDLRRVHSQIDVSRMLGLTNKEMLAATKSPVTHNWTVSQLYRLSLAIDMPFETMLKQAFPPKIGFS